MVATTTPDRINPTRETSIQAHSVMTAVITMSIPELHILRGLLMRLDLSNRTEEMVVRDLAAAIDTLP